MRTEAEFDRAFQALGKELDNMSGEEFFAMFGIDLNQLPPARP